jgi:hypothetical protein
VSRLQGQLTADHEQIIRERLGSLRDAVADYPDWEWGPIGDAHLTTWNWAVRLEQAHGVDHQQALRIAFEEVRPEGAP